MIVTEFFPFQFQIDPVAIAGSSLWATGLYLGFFPLSQWIAERLSQWFNFAERSLYLSAEEFERTRSAREAQNDFLGSLLSVLPFLLVGGLCYYGCLVALGNASWGISLGLILCIGAGVYEMGRRDSQSHE